MATSQKKCQKPKVTITGENLEWITSLVQLLISFSKINDRKINSLPSLLFLYTLLFPYVLNAMLFFWRYFRPVKATINNGHRPTCFFLTVGSGKKNKQPLLHHAFRLIVQGGGGLPETTVEQCSRDPYDIPLVIADWFIGMLTLAYCSTIPYIKQPTRVLNTAQLARISRFPWMQDDL